jgi:hypothetical protein
MARKLKPVSPGEMLAEEFPKPLGMSNYRLAKEIGVPALGEWFGCCSGRSVGRHGRASRSGWRERADTPDMGMLGYFSAASCRRVSSST